MTTPATRITTPQATFIAEYPAAWTFIERQAEVYWPHFEVKVEKDKQDILVNLTDAERHGVITTLKLFTQYELIVNDFWIEVVYREYPRAGDIRPMAAAFSAMELATHAKFYSRINEELGLVSYEFYNSYIDDPVLKQRIDFLETALASKDRLRKMGCFAFAEGAILYSSFAFLKHFQSKGKNKIMNIVRGINYSSRDESLHAEAAAWIFRVDKAEQREAGIIDDAYEVELEADIRLAAETVYDHECAIIAKIFEQGRIDGITEHQLQVFVKSRINFTLRHLGYDNQYDVKDNPIADWFYDGIAAPANNDFFAGQGKDYGRGWDVEGFAF